MKETKRINARSSERIPDATRIVIPETHKPPQTIQRKKIQFGEPIDFRGLRFAPINEQGVVYLFGLIANDLNMRVESIQQGYPDCTAIRYVGRGKWERVNIEFEFKSSNFDHDPDKCDILVCWEDDLSQGKRDSIKGDDKYPPLCASE